jgi:DNA-binding beta-propeller fold protein YncE
MTIRRFSLVPMFLLVAVCVGLFSGSARATPNAPDPASGFLLNGRQLTPRGTQVKLGNFPTGGAVTADGRFLWTVSAGFGGNDIRIVDTARHRVRQVIPMAGASGGIALDSAHRLAYVSGIRGLRWLPWQSTLPGFAAGDVVLVYRWNAKSGAASFVRTISVAPPAGTPPGQACPASAAVSAWPQRLAVSPGGKRLLVPLNLADLAAVVDLGDPDQVKYVAMGSGAYPFGAAILPGGGTGLVSNEASGTVAVVDMQSGVKLRDITVRPPLSHPEGIVVDAAGRRAYVALSASDEVVVLDLRAWRVERTISVGRSAGLGTMPVALAIGPRGDRLFVAESGANEIAVIRLPGRRTRSSLAWKLVGRIPTSEDPQSVVTAAAGGGRVAQLLYVAARGFDVAANLSGPNPTATDPMDPLFYAFDWNAPTANVFGPGSNLVYLPGMITGRAGLMTLPTDERVRSLSRLASAQIRPRDAQKAPAGTPLRAGGPIKHIFFIVRENRSYDQLLGDLGRGNGDPKLVVFGKEVTPNLHALVTRFPLLDHVFANSEASIQGHFWTTAASVPDYVDRNWVANYAGRQRPNDFGFFAESFPGNGFLFNQAERQHISYFNYGEAMSGGLPDLPDRTRSAALLAEEERIAANSDLGPTGATPPPAGQTYPSELGPPGQIAGIPVTQAYPGEVFDAYVPDGAPSGSYSHMGSFRDRFESQLATDSAPMFNYLWFSNDHTRGTQTGFPTPTAMVADCDQALGQFVDLISHSSIWSSSVIFVVEDDSQDGADHVNAHRIPVAVIGPYARKGAIIHRRYDLPSVIRSMELIMGMKPLSLNDALATPMYDAFTPAPSNAAAYDAIPAKVDLLVRNSASAPWAAASSRFDFSGVDQVSQRQLDAIIWRSVYGADSTPPPPGPGAEKEAEADK